MIVADRQKKKPQKHVTVPVKQVASGTFRPRYRKYEDYVIVSDTLEGLGVLSSSSGAAGATASTGPFAGHKRKGDNAAGGETKKPTLCQARAVVLPTHIPAVFVETTMAPTPTPTPPSPPSKVVVQEEKKTEGEPEVEELGSEGTPPAQNVKGLFKDSAGETIVDTLDASGNLIDQRGGGEDKGDKKQKSPIQEKVSSSDAAGRGDEEQPPIQPHETELDIYYRTYSGGHYLHVHSPRWTILQEDGVMTNLSLCREALTGLGPLAKAAWIREFGRESLQYQLASYLKADFEAYKRTEQWAAAAGHKQVRSLTNLLAEERKLWKEACARENEKFYRLRQEINNLKAANVTLAQEKVAADAAIADLIKEKAAAEAAMKETEARGAAAVKELADANAGRSSLLKTIEDLKEARNEVKTRETILGDVNRHLEETEARARQVAEERDVLITSNAQLVDDRAWMREFGIANVANAILNAP
ncbi:hypothetical protein HanRHA438_Chr06g0273361 [Helianthus annuus]|uniref:Uncharacterized protein n=1 Tax=Helianthus annuus TaxID=4232 RepID=A0A9K3IVG1_HELAN|nr:hypothetical protein HanXRQr2_Chr06g0264051 [Helianthus annuus]KAJ0560901.1 hypothetical protein HanHA300_Chr06g0216641 [Helianthus annuus]KAJ0567370.1 hypothetical protein HanIR_Chr06g0284011 [Helianthus annuus]KAJ0573940.1 hypothetical protein HanHA89_Chr06g0232441 [Helianthus annuus]KAJ0738274.1 hypothetical protein HanLR1_Chr06g0216361 [Helianthus annuus]